MEGKTIFQESLIPPLRSSVLVTVVHQKGRNYSFFPIRKREKYYLFFVILCPVLWLLGCGGSNFSDVSEIIDHCYIRFPVVRGTPPKLLNGFPFKTWLSRIICEVLHVQFF